MGHVARVRARGHVARAPWEMLQGLHGTCWKGLKRHIARGARAQGSTVYFDFSFSKS